LGEGAPLSASSLQRLKEKWQGEYEQWKSTGIEEKEWAYCWADGIYVKAGIGKEKAALLVVIGVQEDGTKRFLALEPGYRESKESWALVLRQLKARGVDNARLFVGDGNLDRGRRLARSIPSARSSFAGITRCST
jgi:putative transposase